ncbi:SdiA-regulated domain-containing protein [Brumimicrobium oceani]|uniref:Uncharacterized protein n=1 Tax=Brumimicrobium oceani TaxID=2100725 RepID=A0A2U2XHD5_9FLAO|nr:SdiA-regulated domain-containing protein [Brumimicrobium oceani]PWH87209.1 hypothetical protein DIT68_02800 [Brumimicrobium oceani]
MKTTLFLAILLSSFVCIGQKTGDHISNSEKNEYFKIIYEKCPNADILKLENKEDYVEIEYLCDGKYYEIGISNSKVLFIESKAESNTIPKEEIKKKLSKKYEGWLLDEISLITTNDTSFFKVEIIKDGLEQNLFFTTEGKWYKSKSIVSSDNWTIDKLGKSSLFQNAEYNFLSPAQVYNLPDVLREVSGIALSEDEKSILCVQDELGAVFEYDFLQEEIKNIHRFTDIGDFEGVSVIGELVYVLRSDGKIFTFNYKNKTEIKEQMLSLNSFNFESLAFDESNKQFLTISKDAALNQPESKRFLYQFPVDYPAQTSLLLEVDILEINKIIAEEITDMQENNVMFNPSEIAIHPITREIYILAASDRILTIYNEQGLKSVYPLPAELYYKPEGLAFFKNGDLLISSEGDKRGIVKGNVMLFKYGK